MVRQRRLQPIGISKVNFMGAEMGSRKLRDPDLLADAKKRGWPVDPIDGKDLAALAKEVTSQPPEVVARLKKLLGE